MHPLGTPGPILVTGSGGFIGGHVVRTLQQDPARVVIPATRDGRGGSRPLDMRNAAGMLAGLSGVASVVHCAVGDRAVTVDGTAALLAACHAAGVRRFVHISSIAVYGGAAGAVTEAAPMLPSSGRGYGAWKAAAERACLAQPGMEPGMEVVRLRPTIVYGPGSQLWVAHLARRIRSGRWGTFGPAGEGTCNLVHVADVVSAVKLALFQPAVGGAVFNVNGAEPVTWNDWFTRMADALNAPPLRRVGPRALQWRGLAALPLKAANRVRPGLATSWLLGAPASSERALFALKATYPIGAARAALGWQPQVCVSAGLADCIRWLGQA